MENERGRIKIVPVAILLLVIAGVFYWLNPSLFGNSHIQYSASYYGLKGEVKSLTVFSYEAEQKFGEWEKGKREEYGTRNRTTFDEAGLVLFEEGLDKDGNTETKTIMEHENGRWVEMMQYNGKTGEPMFKTKVIHISSNQLSKEAYNIDGEMIYSTKEKWKNNAPVHIEHQYYINGNTKDANNGYYEIKYKDGLEVSYSAKNSNFNDESVRYEYLKFDDKGNWTERLVSKEIGEGKDAFKSENIEARFIDYY